MTFPNMQHPSKKDMEQLRAIRHYLDNRTREPEIPSRSSDDVLTAVIVIYILIAMSLIFTGFGAIVGIAMLAVEFVVYLIPSFFE